MKPRLERKVESLQVFDFMTAKAACPYMRHVYKLFHAKIFRNTAQKSLRGVAVFVYVCCKHVAIVAALCYSGLWLCFAILGDQAFPSCTR